MESKTNKQNKKPKLIEQIDGCHWQPWQNGWSKWSNDTDLIQNGQKIQTSSYKINKSWGCNVELDDYSKQCCNVHCNIYLKVLGE